MTASWGGSIQVFTQAPPHVLFCSLSQLDANLLACHRLPACPARPQAVLASPQALRALASYHVLEDRVT